ncbi:DUF4214 domain-containing protein [Zwartia sp.]|uniref:DUF4214 domain-containing protein n=1 Tax=Zwartia sp. TaxID=2978004 RepID=UPI003BB09575
MDYSYEGNVELLSEESVNSDSSSRTGLSQIDFPSVAVNADSFSRDIHSSVAQLYIVMLGRAPEKAGLNIWSGELANGADIQDVCSYFAACSEVSDTFRGMTSAQQVNMFYLNAFDRSADSEGLKYWGGLIDDGIPFYEVARMLTEAAFNGSGGVDAADTGAIRSKVERATNFALHSQNDDIDSARDAVRPSTPDVGAPVQTDPAPQLPVNVTPGPSDPGPVNPGPVTPEPPPVPTLTYSSGTFVESTANNGTIGSSIVITLAGDTFSTNVANKILVANVPEGLVASFTLASNTILTATLTGTASPSASVHDINNLSFTFLDGAFETTPNASTVVNYTKTSLVVDFIDGTSTDEGGGSGGSGGSGNGGGGGGGGGGSNDNGDLYGDQYVLLRDLDATDGFGNGEAVLDANGQQILVGTNGAPIYYVLNADGDYEIPADLLAFTQTVELERANVVRAPESVLNHALTEALSKIDAATSITTDPAGRIMCDGATIDSPLENLALYKYLMTADGQTNWNDVVDNWPDKFKALAGDDALNPDWSPASLLGAVFSKESTVLVDAVLYENTMLGVNTVTQVDGEPHVDYFNFNNGSSEAFNYDRESHFADVWFQWYEDTDGDLNNLELVQKSLMDAVFNGENWSDEYIAVSEDGAAFEPVAATSSGMNDFSQSVDDSRAVINFMHESFGAVQIQAPVSSAFASADAFLTSVESSQALIFDEIDSMTPSQELSTPTTDSPAQGYALVQTPTSDVEELFSLEEPDEAEDAIQLDAVLTDSDYVFEHTSGCSGGSSTQESHLSAMASHYVEVPLPVAEVSI